MHAEKKGGGDRSNPLLKTGHGKKNKNKKLHIKVTRPDEANAQRERKDVSW